MSKYYTPLFVNDSDAVTVRPKDYGENSFYNHWKIRTVSEDDVIHYEEDFPTSANDILRNNEIYNRHLSN